jgi:hypothetical protein
MTPACSLSDRFRGLCTPHPLGLLLPLLLSARVAVAQEPAAGRAAPTTSPAVDPAPGPTVPDGGPAAATSEREPLPAEPAPPAPEERAPKGKAKHHKPTDDDAEHAEEKKHDKPSKHDLRLKGRVFALAELSHRHERVVTLESGLVERDRDALDLSLQSARFGVDYRSPLRWLSAEVELEVAGKVRAKDAFVKAGQTFFVKAGQFKVPAAALEVASPWTLPQARRGLVHDLMTDWMDIAGRAPGVAVGYHEKGGLKTRVTLGVFQGSSLKAVLPGDRDVRLIDHASLEAQTYAARAEIAPFGVQLGAWYEQRVSSTAVNQFRHFATFGADATLDRSFERGGVRLWLDGGGGQSPYQHSDKLDADKPAWFAFGRALAAYRFGGVAQGDPYLEPFGFLAVMDPDSEVVRDLTTEAALGIAAGFWDRARVTLQGEYSNGQRNFPEGLLDAQSPDHTSVLLQAGARF